jgi:hypothetical protein
MCASDQLGKAIAKAIEAKAIEPPIHAADI